MWAAASAYRKFWVGRPEGRAGAGPLGVLRAGPGDRLAARLEGQQLALVLVARRVAGGELLEEEVLRVGTAVRSSPGDVTVVPQDDRRDAREAHPGDVIGTGIGEWAAVQPDDEPHRRHGNRQGGGVGA